MGRPLGYNQLGVLRGMRDHKGWSPSFGGWTWGTTLNTLRIIESLARRGLVAMDDEGIWRLTPKGFDALDAIHAEQAKKWDER